MKWPFFFLFFLSIHLSATITLVNDSPSTLKATIYTAQQTLVGTEIIPPNQRKIWYYSPSPFTKNLNQPYTPFSVHWTCYSHPKKNQQKKKSPPKEFGYWPSVAPGATVTAKGSPIGSHSCR